jgi:hypothetical protein
LTTPDVVAPIVARLAARPLGRAEAEIQADIYALLTSPAMHLAPDQVARLEVPTQDGTRRRLDVEVGHAVIEVKRDLRNKKIREDAEKQLVEYVASRHRALGTRYVGILTDGTEWYLYQLAGLRLNEVAKLTLNESSPDADSLVAWLESILATETSIEPSPEVIKERLGVNSPGHLLDHATLRSLFQESSARPEVRLKRELWSKLLRTAFGKAFTDDDEMFIDHTLLVLQAEIIAHAVIGFDISAHKGIAPQVLVRGTAFADSLIYGVVEEDFFDWVLDVSGGSSFIRTLADRISKFDWSHVEHDVLKVLYESVIAQEARASLGEYYTPDWLAYKLIEDSIKEPLSQRVLDPSCGSGTFVFHSVRAYLAAAEAAGIPNGEAVSSVTKQVSGMDVHPVAVTLARVTYLMAIGRERLAADDRGPLSIPVYLGDSMQWVQSQDLFGGVDNITVSTHGDELVEGGGGALFGDDLVFPRSVLEDASVFDMLVNEMAERAKDVSSRKSKDLASSIVRKFGVSEQDAPRIVETFDTMRRLHRTGRDHIWGYYVRNLIRPVWMAEPKNRVDVLVGNPPWLRYSKMTPTMQARFKEMSKNRGLLSGPLGASGRDLSTLFVARCVELYLRPQGRFGFVMPHGTLTRKPHEAFRSGVWSLMNGGESTRVQFLPSWDLSKSPTGFPMVSCVIRGQLTGQRSIALSSKVLRWESRSRTSGGTWNAIGPSFTITEGVVSVTSASEGPSLAPSPYKRRFRQGAVLAPRALLFVTTSSISPLGAGAGRIHVASRRSSLEKKPWSGVASMSGMVERSFVRNIHLGETVLPFRVLEPLQAVLPIMDSRILSDSEINDQSALAKWWAQAEERWADNKSKSDPGSLLDRIDFHGQLSSQLPAVFNRVVYTKAGNHIAAARVLDSRAVIDHKLYWAAASTDAEALYLAGVLNSNAVMEIVRPLQAQGLFGGRDIDKNVFSVSIPIYDPRLDSHKRIANLAHRAEYAASLVDFEGTSDFKRMRSVVRSSLQSILEEIDRTVQKLINV